MKIRLKRPWWTRAEVGVLPPFGIWIDPKLAETAYGERALVHMRIHSHQFRHRPLSYYPRRFWYVMCARSPSQDALESEAAEKSGFYSH